MMRRFPYAIPSVSYVTAVALFTRCFFDADLPLRNDPPVCTDRSSISRDLVFPDSVVCTLSVDDGNDTMLDVWTLPCSTNATDPAACDPALRMPWPGGAAFIDRGYGAKRLLLTLDTNLMGRFDGTLFLEDGAAAILVLPYAVGRQFFDPFDDYPPDDAWWHMYRPNDSTRIRPYRLDGKLLFSFDKSADSSPSLLSTGIRTRFSLEDDFYTTVDFRLRDEMDDAFEVAFFISTSTDTGRWSGEKAGIFITGIGGRLRFECRSIDLQSYSYESGATAGELGIRRADSTLSCFFNDGNPGNSPKPLTSQIFPINVPVYVHLKMSVRDLSRNRNCYWNDFRIPEGLIRFPEE